MIIEFPEQYAPDSFHEVINQKSRYLILYGGRASGKSTSIAKRLIMRCMVEPFFRCLLTRKTANTIKDSQWQTIKDCVEDFGLSDYFRFTVSPLEIRCKNGNKFICRGQDEVGRIKSVRDITVVWWEEEIPTEKDFITVTSSLRTLKAPYIQEVFTINPEVEGNYQDNWFYKKFFAGEPNLSFTRTVTTQVKGKQVTNTAIIHHSNHWDNPFITDSYRAELEEYKNTNEHYYNVYTCGVWGTQKKEGLFYKKWVKSKHTGTVVYNNQTPLHFSFDFNVRPYITCTVWQMEGFRAWQIDEFCLKTPDNSTTALSEKVLAKYRNHAAGCFVYGDPSGGKHTTVSNDSDFDIIIRILAPIRPTNRVLRSAPGVAIRGQWLNHVLLSNSPIELLIGNNCINTIADYNNVQEAADGTKLKKKVTIDGGAPFEQYGHTSDANDYFLCKVFEENMKLFINRKSVAIIEIPTHTDTWGTNRNDW